MMKACHTHTSRLNVSPRNRSHGFTLVELIIVIVIMGSLAAVAMPKFLNAKTDAVVAATNAMKGAVSSAANQLHLKCAIQPNCSMTSGASTVINGGVTYQVYHGWVDGGVLNTNQIDVAVQASGFITSVVANNTRWVHNKAADPANCYVEYIEALLIGSEPTITAVTTGC